MRRLGATGIDVFPLCLGGNVFGWTADERESFAVLDAYVAAGGNFIDTADGYSAWVQGNAGGESEAIIGRWLAARGNRDSIVLATKVGRKPDRTGLAADTVRAGADESLRRLRTDYVDLFYAHADDPEVPLEEALGALDGLVREGKARFLAASNYTAPRLAEALAVSEREGLAAFVALQPHYNLVERAGYEGELASLCAARGLACVPYWGLAKGFLTGKYRADRDDVASARAPAALIYLDRRGERVLAALDEIAAAHRTTVPAVALAWLAARPAVVTPIASARTPEQLADLLPMAGLALSAAEVEALDAASADPGQ